MKKNRPIIIALIILITFLGISTSQYVFADDPIIQLENGKTVVLHEDYTWEYVDGPKYDFDFTTIKDNEIPGFLRKGISADAKTIKTAVEMYLQGWRYTMPRPKSNQAAWGNHDGRTTWFYGYWNNIKTEVYSKETPVKKQNGYYYGDGQNLCNYWRNGGSPPYPTKIEWLLSSGGGVKPR